MKHLILAVVIVALISSASPAKEWHPYLGIGGLITQPIPSTIRFASSEGWFPVFLSSGIQFEIGSRVHRHEWYLAFHAFNSPMRHEEKFTDFYADYPDGYVYWRRDIHTETSWQEKRFDLGLRHYPTDPDARTKPFYGAAFSLGWSKLREHRYGSDFTYIAPAPVGTTYDYSYSSDRKSKLNPGLTFEFGVSERLSKQLEALLKTNVQTYLMLYSDETSDTPMTVTYYVLSPSLALQLRYMFR